MAKAKLGYWFDTYVLLPLCVIIVIATVGLYLWMKIEESRQAHHDEAVPWQLLIDGYAAIEQGIESEAIDALAAQKEITLFGYMYPLETAEEHSHFLLISHSASCPFHQLAGQGNVVEVKSAEPIAHSYAPFLVSGRFHVADQVGAEIQYRLDDAVLVTP
ncbi:MAG: DUF3299 domain-containing protein [Rickettsiales bacterium]|nr:DUF3299 domain-containing protein [Rickettsiales bacterium]